MEDRGCFIRVADFSDARSFNIAVNNCGGTSFFKALFGQVNLPSTLENCLQAFMAFPSEDDDNALGFLAINDSINLANDIDYDATLAYLRQFLPVQVSNTLFINFWVLDERNRKKSEIVGKELLYKAFDSNPHLDYLIWASPKGASSYEFVDKNVSTINRPDTGTSKDKHTLPGMDIFLVERSFILPKLSVRDARIEDSDDLLPIVRQLGSSNEQESSVLSDLINSQDMHNRFFVGCSNNVVCGMLATSVEVNVSLVQKIFDVDNFPDLLLEKEPMPRPSPLLLSVMGDIRLVSPQALSTSCDSLNCIFINAEDISADEDNNAGLTALKEAFDFRVSKANKAGVYPNMCVVYGFPRNDVDAEALLNSDFKFNAYFELMNTTEDADIEDNDDFCNAHIDAVELLRNRWLEDGKGSPKIPWQKLLIDTAIQSNQESTQSVIEEMTGIYNIRAKEVEKLEKLYINDPQKANGFAIVSFCIKNQYQSRTEDLLRVAFEDNPKKDYALYMVSCNSPPSRLLDFMTPVNLRNGVSFDQSLFLVHRDFLNTSELINIKRLAESQVPNLSRFLGPRPAAELKRVNALCEAALREVDVDIKENPSAVSFVACIDNEIVAIMNLSRKITSMEDVNWYRQNYDLEDIINYDRHRGRNQACILQWYINPIYFRWSKYMLREAMRQYQKTVLYYNDSSSVAPFPYIIQDMLSVRPRRRTQIHPTSLLLTDNIRPSENAVGNTGQLFVISKRHMSLEKPTILTRVLVIGGSMSSFALLETLTFLSKFYVPNITLVLDCPPSYLNFNGTNNSSANSKYIDDLCGCLSPTDTSVHLEQELLAMGLAHRVNLVTGKLTDIDRVNRAVVISDEIIVEYDVLVIANNAQDLSFRKFPSTYSLHPTLCAERGIFGLGNPKADYIAVKWLKAQPRNPQIVVYGSVFQGLNAVGRLLKYGIDPSLITIVLITKLAKAFDGEDMLSHVATQGLQASGVTCYFNSKVLDVALSNAKLLDGVLIETITEPHPDDLTPKVVKSEHHLSCGTLLCCTELSCELDTFTAVNESGLIFDGGLIVDNDCRTIDPYIFAIGQFTRLSKIYKHITSHSNYNSREMGIFCALKIIELYIDPTSPKVKYSRMDSTSGPKSIAKRSLRDNKDINKPATFASPLTLYMDFPGNLVFFYSQLPNFVSNDAAVTTMPTMDQQNNRYCSLKCNSLGILSRFAYIGSQYIEERNFSNIVGWHDAYLNNASYSYEKGLVTDWISFFRQDWALIVYFDRFTDFANIIRTNLTSDKGMYSILDRVFELADSSSDDSVVTQGRRKFIGDRSETIPESTQKSIETYSIDFLRKNKASFLRFYVPGSK